MVLTGTVKLTVTLASQLSVPVATAAAGTVQASTVVGEAGAVPRPVVAPFQSRLGATRS